MFKKQGVVKVKKNKLKGQPIGREALITEIKHEMIPYSPEKLIDIGEKELKWCRNELIKVSKKLGYNNWKDGLEHVKIIYVKP